MYKIIAVTNRKICTTDFLGKIEQIVSTGKADAVILREKDLAQEEYVKLAERVMAIGERYQVPCILHNYMEAAIKLNCPGIHLPFGKFQQNQKLITEFKIAGTSVHSVEEAVDVEKLGASYVIAGHIFETDCKPGLPPRGLGFLKEVCRSVQIPVYAIGGINGENMRQIIEAGAAGGCIMSGFMKD